MKKKKEYEEQEEEGEIDESTKTKEQNNIGFSIWDCGGQEVLHHMFLTSNAIYVVVFDIPKMILDSSSELDFVKYWINAITLDAPVSLIVLVGTHKDEIKETLQWKSISKLLQDTFLGTNNKNKNILDFNQQQELWFYPIDNMSDDHEKGLELRSRFELLALEKDPKLNSN